MKFKLSIICFVVICSCQVVKAQQTGEFRDERDGWPYATVKIGSQWWMSDNLAFKSETGCLAYNNDLLNVYLYGFLYNWETALKVCPAGWHLPSKSEWDELINYLGGDSVAGDKLKAPKEWETSEDRTVDACGFNVKPAGSFSSYYQEYNYMNVSTGFWTSTPDDEVDAWAAMVYRVRNDCELWEFSKIDYQSVRCIKD